MNCKPILLAAVISVLVGCIAKDDLSLREDEVYSETFINTFYDFDEIVVYLDGAEPDDPNDITLYAYKSRTALSWVQKEDKALYSDFLAECAKYGDIGYNRNVFVSVKDKARISLPLHNMVSITVTSDCDFDADHPAGTPLDDIIVFKWVSPQRYIDSRYTEQYEWSDEQSIEYHCLWDPYLEYTYPYSGLLSEISADDLRLAGFLKFRKLGILHFATLPDAQTVHNLTVAITLDDSRVIRKTFEYAPNK